MHVDSHGCVKLSNRILTCLAALETHRKYFFNDQNVGRLGSVKRIKTLEINFVYYENSV